MNAIQASYLPPESTVLGHVMLKNTEDMRESNLLKIEQSKYLTGRKEAEDGNIEEDNRAEIKYKSMKGWRKLIVVSEVKAKSHGGRKRKRSRGIDIDYDPPKSHPPSHN